MIENSQSLKLEFSYGFKNPLATHTLAVREKLGHTQSVAARERLGIENLMRYLYFGKLVESTYMLVKLQRWFRKVIVRRRERRLAVIMCLHARLGTSSGLGKLGGDLLGLVIG